MVFPTLFSQHALQFVHFLKEMCHVTKLSWLVLHRKTLVLQQSYDEDNLTKLNDLYKHMLSSPHIISTTAISSHQRLYTLHSRTHHVKDGGRRNRKHSPF